MSQIIELDPRVIPLEKKLKIGGTALVAAAASGVVIVGGLSIIAAAGVALLAIGAVNFVPVGARYIALKKQQALTALAETFSEETIREDERLEDGRVAEQQNLFKTQSAEFGNVVEELRENLANSTLDEKNLINEQIEELHRILLEAENAVKQKVEDLVQLKRVNKLYISLNRAAEVMKISQDLARNAEQIQRIETARNAIKTRMREAVAGQKLEAMNAPLQTRLSVSKVAQIASASSSTLQPFTSKEAQHVPTNR